MRSLCVCFSLHPNQFIHDYDQVKSYQRYYRTISPREMDSVEMREGRTSHQRPHCTDEVYNPRLRTDVLLSSIPRLIVTIPVRLIICCSGGLCLPRTPTDCKNSQAMCQTSGWLREM